MVFIVGDMVAWEMIDGATMTGEVTQQIWDTVYVKRVDGTEVTMKTDKPRFATYEEIESSIKWFQTLSE